MRANPDFQIAGYAVLLILIKKEAINRNDGNSKVIPGHIAIKSLDIFLNNLRTFNKLSLGKSRMYDQFD